MVGKIELSENKKYELYYCICSNTCEYGLFRYVGDTEWFIDSCCGNCSAAHNVKFCPFCGAEIKTMESQKKSERARVRGRLMENEKPKIKEMANAVGIETISFGGFLGEIFKDAPREELLKFLSGQHERIAELYKENEQLKFRIRGLEQEGER